MPKSNHPSFPCPNCNTVVEKNYCPQCGQPAHLHDGSFWSMIMHFFAHYLHYESKFLQTLKMVMFKPGRATMDFKEKKRARHVEPMSLYIFVVITYFIVNGLLTNLYSTLGIGEYSATVIAEEQAQMAEARRAENKERNTVLKGLLGQKGFEKFQKFRNTDSIQIDKKLNPMGPKIFFFMVPVFALLLSLFYYFRKNYTFVEHTVFSIHVHTFFFIVQLIDDILGFIRIPFIDFLILILLAIYTIIAQRRFYKANLKYSTAVFVVSFCVYMVIFIILLVTIVLLFI